MASTLLQTNNAVFVVASVEPEQIVPAQLQPVSHLVADENLHWVRNHHAWFPWFARNTCQPEAVEILCDESHRSLSKILPAENCFFMQQRRSLKHERS